MSEKSPYNKETRSLMSQPKRTKNKKLPLPSTKEIRSVKGSSTKFNPFSTPSVHRKGLGNTGCNIRQTFEE